MAVVASNKGRVTLLPVSLALDTYAGFLETTTGECYRISLACAAGGGKVVPGSIEVDPQLADLLRPFNKALAARASHASTLRSFLVELLDLVDQVTFNNVGFFTSQSYKS